MIPKCIRLTGFLCYRHEQVVDFDGAALWMLTGLNGSGKSSVFDAMTYALFGQHRGGATGASELINKSENSFAIEFDFLLDGGLHRIKRTVKRRGAGTAATQQIMRWEAERWEAVADTQRRAEFDAWIAQHLGLNYETFTSSILLLQGKAERLLDSTAKGRAEVLAGIVDLGRYQRLHERADSRRKALKGEVDALKTQLAVMPEVSEAETAAADARIGTAQEAMSAAQAEIERWQRIEFEAKRWGEVERRLAEARLRNQRAAALIDEAAAIERDVARLRELREVLPHLEVIAQRLNDVRTSEDGTKAITDEVRRQQGQLFGLEQRHEELTHQLGELRRRRTDDEKELQAAAARLPDLLQMIERLDQLERHDLKMSNISGEIAKLPQDPAKLAAAQAAVEELDMLDAAIRPLEEFAKKRTDLAGSVQKLEKARHAEATIKAHGEECRHKADAARAELEAAQANLRAAEAEEASHAALVAQAERQRAALDSLEGAKTCSACGQALTAKHLKDEKSSRDAALADARKKHRAAATRLKSARSAEKKCAEERDTLEQELTAAREKYLTAKNQAAELDKEAAQLRGECRRWYDEVPEAMRGQISSSPVEDWTTTTWPKSSDLTTIRRRVLDLPTRQRELEQARDAQGRLAHLTGQLKSLQHERIALQQRISGEPEAIRAEEGQLRSRRDALNKSVEGLRITEQKVVSESEAVQRDLGDVRERITTLNGRLETEQTRREMCQQAIAAARNALRQEWRDRSAQIGLQEFNRLRGERDDLERERVEERERELASARVDAESLKNEIKRLEAEREEFSAEARRDPALVEQDLARARSQHEQCLRDHNAATLERSALAARGRQREELSQRIVAREREWSRYKTLAELLGRDRLQRFLLRQAERQIVEYANGILDRLSSGTLLLRLIGGDDGAPADEALKLEAINRATGHAPVDVAFLSGSQRFRVAVSLALGIGQYAGRLHRPIESVIIDEGFGSLDRNGRQVMIQELHNLRAHLQCILLVSHQEEFADAFADGYRFELIDGATRVTRLQR